MVRSNRDYYYHGARWTFTVQTTDGFRFISKSDNSKPSTVTDAEVLTALDNFIPVAQLISRSLHAKMDKEKSIDDDNKRP